MKVRQSAEVAAALTSGKPVVALESTITSKMGLPAPYNRECFDRVNAAIRAAGAVPAVTAVIDANSGRALSRTMRRWFSPLMRSSPSAISLLQWQRSERE